jgi:enterochelin esterase-like enzyme
MQWRCLLAILAGLASASPSHGWQTPVAPDRTLPWVTSEVVAPRVAFHTFESRAAEGPVSYHVYTPAEYDQPESRLPVLYWLHGTLGGIAGVAPLSRHFDAAIRAERMPPMIVVFVNGLPRRLWADSKDGSAPVESVFVGELIPEVDRRFRTIAAREGRVVEGFSMGGYGAARVGFRHPDLFAGISILAGGPLDLELQGPRAQRNPRLREALLRDVCGGDPDFFKAISPWTIAGAAATELHDRGTVIRQAVGERDDTRDLNRRFHERLVELGIPHDYVEIPDVDHDAPAVLAALLDRGDFYRRALEGTEPSAGPTPRSP